MDFQPNNIMHRSSLLLSSLAVLGGAVSVATEQERKLVISSGFENPFPAWGPADDLPRAFPSPIFTPRTSQQKRRKQRRRMHPQGH